MILRFSPDQGDSSAGTQNTDSAAEPQNTDVGQGSRPQSADPNVFSNGMKEGRARLLRDLGFSSAEEAAEQLESLRNPQQVGEGETQTDVKEHPDFQNLTRKYGSLERKVSDQSKQLETLRAQADEARIEKIRSAALAAGVGPGGQLEAFISVFGNRLQFAADRSLEVHGQLPDGSFAPMGQSLGDFFTEVLEQNQFYRAAGTTRGGNGTQMQPTRAPEQADRSGQHDPQSLNRIFGISRQSDSKMDRLRQRVTGQKGE